MNSAKIYPKRIKELRISRNLTQGELANKLSVSQRTVASWEVGRTEPSIGTLLQMADFFGVSIDFLVRSENLSNEEIIEINSFLMKEKFGDDSEVFFKKLQLLNQDHIDFLVKYVNFAFENEDSNNK